ncbi:MAG: hypothetical protein AB1414_05260 [bacterium]
MVNTNKEEIRKWIKIWKIAGEALAKVKRNELQSYDYKKNQVIVNEMLQYACEHSKVRLNSGLVEQQQIFIKFREKMG